MKIYPENQTEVKLLERALINFDRLSFGQAVSIRGFVDQKETELILFNNVDRSNRLFLVCQPQTRKKLLCRLASARLINSHTLADKIVLEEALPEFLPLSWVVHPIKKIETVEIGCYSVTNNDFDLPTIGKSVEELDTSKLNIGDEFFLDHRKNIDHLPEVNRFIVVGWYGLFKRYLHVRQIFFNTQFQELIVGSFLLNQGKYKPGDRLPMYSGKDRNALTVFSFYDCKVVTREELLTLNSG